RNVTGVQTCALPIYGAPPALIGRVPRVEPLEQGRHRGESRLRLLAVLDVERAVGDVPEIGEELCGHCRPAVLDVDAQRAIGVEQIGRASCRAGGGEG